MPLFFSLSGLRGIVGEDLSPELVTGFGQAFGTYLDSGPVVFGRDARRSSPELSDAVAAGLIAAGSTGIDLGVVPTPTVLLEVAKRKAHGGIVVTASHNPSEWNGLKFIAARGSFLNKEEFDAFSRIVSEKKFRLVVDGTAGRVEPYLHAREEHLVQILNHRFIQNVARKKIKIGVDAGNGAASLFAPELGRRLGAEVYELYCTPDGTTPRPPEPLEEHLRDLARFVKEQSLDIGFAFDPDGDRLACVDETGTPIGEERTLALATGFVLAKEQGPVVINLSTSRTTEAVANRFGSHVYRTSIGEANVVAKMRRVRAVIGGEGNGGVIFPEINYGRDGLVAAALIVSLIRETDQPLSGLVARLPQYRMKKMKVTIAGRIEWQKIKDAFSGSRIDETDGLRIDDADWWLHIRSSNTEPVVRIIAEATTEARVESLVRETLHLLEIK